MNNRQKYRQFLKTEFWVKLSEEKKRLVGKCEKCGAVENLQSHHKIYRPDWFDTKLEDLVVLCRECHRREHGLGTVIEWTYSHRTIPILYRDDWRFNMFLYYLMWLRQMMVKTGRNLKRRELWYCSQAINHYPPTEKDSCMKFHVEQTLKTNEICHTFYQ